MRLQTEMAVHQAGVEAEVLEPGLQGRHVVAVHWRTELVGQGAGAQLVGRLLEGAEGGLADHAVD